MPGTMILALFPLAVPASHRPSWSRQRHVKINTRFLIKKVIIRMGKGGHGVMTALAGRSQSLVSDSLTMRSNPTWTASKVGMITYKIIFLERHFIKDLVTKAGKLTTTLVSTTVGTSWGVFMNGWNKTSSFMYMHSPSMAILKGKGGRLRDRQSTLHWTLSWKWGTHDEPKHLFLKSISKQLESYRIAMTKWKRRRCWYPTGNIGRTIWEIQYILPASTHT